MSRCPSRAESPPGADMLISPRRTSRWGYFGKQRMAQWPRFITEELFSRTCDTTLRQIYHLLNGGSCRTSHEVIPDPRGMCDDGFRLDVSLRLRAAATKPLQR